MMKTESIGSFKVIVQFVGRQLDTLYECSKTIGLSLIPSIEIMGVEYIRSIKFDGNNLQCGVCLDSQYAVIGDVGNGYKVNVVDIRYGTVVDSSSAVGNMKRLFYDKNNNSVFLSCWAYNLYCIDIRGNKFINIKR